ncbi:MAG TPA: hypothetical protein VFT20_11715, partial [Candidatus Limnocylindrales bacterium]|nr:hypothetical protein [Candidatus Limnocylindrales bacterium]
MQPGRRDPDSALDAFEQPDAGDPARRLGRRPHPGSDRLGADLGGLSAAPDDPGSPCRADRGLRRD